MVTCQYFFFTHNVWYLIYNNKQSTCITGSINTQVCTATKKTPYELVLDKNLVLVMKELYDQGIRDEEDIPDNVTIQNDENVREELGESVVE